MKLWTRLVLLTTACALGAGEALAQPRAGLMGGASIGGGSLSLEGPAEVDPGVSLVRQRDSHLGTFAVDLHLGGMLGAKTAAMLALTFDTGLGGPFGQNVEVRVGDSRVAAGSSETSLWAGVIGVAVQRWLLPRAWVRGGAGSGFLQREFTLGTDGDYLTVTVDRGYAFAVLAAAGVEVYRRANFAVDAEFHLSAFSLRGVGVYAPSVQVGFNWY
jgi:hypothetical protein